MEHVVKENTTGSLRFELEMGWNFWIMISNYLAPAAPAKQKTHWSSPLPLAPTPPHRPVRLPFVFLFSNRSAEFVGTPLRGYLRPRDVMRKKEDYDRKNVFAVSWNITNTVKCHFEWENRAVLIRLSEAGPLWLWLLWKKGSANCDVWCHVWGLSVLMWLPGSVSAPRATLRRRTGALGQRCRSPIRHSSISAHCFSVWQE